MTANYDAAKFGLTAPHDWQVGSNPETDKRQLTKTVLFVLGLACINRFHTAIRPKSSLSLNGFRQSLAPG
jgi:hypothetical protein